MKPGCDLGNGHYQRIFALKYHPDDVHVLITAGWDKIMRVSSVLHQITLFVFSIRVLNETLFLIQSCQ